MRPIGCVSGRSARYTYLPVPMNMPSTSCGSAGGSATSGASGSGSSGFELQPLSEEREQ
jgi:hypothetical protein